MKANGTAMWELLKVEWREQGDRRESEASLGIPNKNGDDIHLSRITILSEAAMDCEFHRAEATLVCKHVYLQRLAQNTAHSR